MHGAFKVANLLVRAGNVPFEVADVIGNVKYIRNGDYRPKRGGLCPPSHNFCLGGATDHSAPPPTQ